jgi:hypothetical protein
MNRRNARRGGAFAVLVLLGTSGEARADIALWEQPGPGGVPVRYVELGAFVQPGFIWRQNDEFNPIQDDTVIVNHARLGVDAKLHDWIFADIELEATPSPTLLDAYVDAVVFPWLGARFGQQKIPFLHTYRFGAQNLSFNDRLVYVPDVDRPYLRYLNERDIGLVFHGRIGDLDADSALPVGEYAFGAFLGRGPNQTRNDDEAFLYTGRLMLHATGLPQAYDQEGDLARNRIPRLTLGGAVYSNCDDRGQWNRGFTADAELRWEGLYASGTFVWFKNGAAGGLGDTLGYGDACAGVAGAPDHIASGGSAQVQYVLPQAWLGVQHALELLVRYDSVSPNAPCDITTGECDFLGGDEATAGYVPPPDFVDADNAPTRHRITFGINYFPTTEQHLRLSLNYQHKRESEDVSRAEGSIVGIHDDIFWIQVTAGL